MFVVSQIGFLFFFRASHLVLVLQGLFRSWDVRAPWLCNEVRSRPSVFLKASGVGTVVGEKGVDTDDGRFQRCRDDALLVSLSPSR